ncbi:MAG TPA: hypothetical protein VF158_07400 [Longimicrobiales bacterium]
MNPDVRPATVYMTAAHHLTRLALRTRRPIGNLRFPSNVLHACTAVAVGIAATGCRGRAAAGANSIGAGAGAYGELVDFSDVFEVLRHVQIRETEAEIVVDPTIRVDAEGGLLLADRGEQRVRRYSSSGDPIWAFGRDGDGRGEFRAPNVAIRIDTRAILAVDARRRAVLRDLRSVRDTIRVLPYDLVSVDDVDRLDRNTVLYSARVVDDVDSVRRYALHIVDLTSGSIPRSFFAPPLSDVVLRTRVASTAGWTYADVDSGLIATVFALSDTVYVHRVDGRFVKKIPFPTTRFRRMTAGPEQGMGRGKWLLTHSFASGAFWAGDGYLLVQYQHFENGLPRWSLLLVRPDGSAEWEVADSPRLYDIDRKEGIAYFDDPNQLTPNFLLAARMRVP